MASTQSDGLGGIFEGDQMHVPLILLLQDVLNYDVWVVGADDGQHGELLSVPDYLLWKGVLTDFALELCEVVAVHYALSFLADLALNPLLETQKVD